MSTGPTTSGASPRSDESSAGSSRGPATWGAGGSSGGTGPGSTGINGALSCGVMKSSRAAGSRIPEGSSLAGDGSGTEDLNDPVDSLPLSRAPAPGGSPAELAEPPAGPFTAGCACRVFTTSDESCWMVATMPAVPVPATATPAAARMTLVAEPVITPPAAAVTDETEAVDAAVAVAAAGTEAPGAQAPSGVVVADIMPEIPETPAAPPAPAVPSAAISRSGASPQSGRPARMGRIQPRRPTPRSCS